MNTRPLFTLDPRLKRCADMVRDGAKIVDVGTDHAYLPIWLVKSGVASSAIAADLREGPLDNAKINIEKYGVTERVKTILSNGLEKINPDEADDIIIAGMGGELISNIIENATWLKNENKHLILQPMSCAEHLRRFLAKNNFKIVQETAVQADNHIYSVMSVKYHVGQILLNNLYPYIGLLGENIDQFSKIYIQKQVYHLENKIKGLEISQKHKELKELSQIVNELNELIK